MRLKFFSIFLFVLFLGTNFSCHAFDAVVRGGLGNQKYGGNFKGRGDYTKTGNPSFHNLPTKINFKKGDKVDYEFEGTSNFYGDKSQAFEKFNSLKNNLKGDELIFFTKISLIGRFTDIYFVGVFLGNFTVNELHGVKIHIKAEDNAGSYKFVTQNNQAGTVYIFRRD